MQPFISFKNVSVRKFDKIVLQNINWEILDDQHWAIIGENGSGKTTLTETFLSKFPIVEGEIIYHFLEKNERIQDAIELVPRDFSFNNIVNSAAQYYQQRFNSQDAEIAPTVREVLQNQLKPIGTIDDNSVQLPPKNITDEHLEKLANMLNIRHLLDRKVISLSNGETRRMLITKSFLKNPKVLILDNPFMGIDVEGRKLLHETINNIAKTGVKIILVTTPGEVPNCVTNMLNLSKSNGNFNRKNANFKFIYDVKIANFERSNDNFVFAVKMREVSVTYSGIKVLDKINWEIKRGEKWALLGANGSGKSTLLSLINADNPQSYANDFDLFDCKRGTGESIWDIKSKIGFVSPELHLYFSKNTEVYKAVASGFFNTNGLYQKLKPEQRQIAESCLNLLNISHLSEKIFSNLSSGEQRQVLLARALVKNPPLLILDEPCQGLDKNKMSYFRDLVNEICLTLDKTLIYVSHYEDEIPKCVTKVLRLEHGKVVF
jgi:molybdate transport system ATP-binding protein